MALYENGILVSGANTLPQMTLAEYQALPVSERPTYWERTDLNYSNIPASDVTYGSGSVEDALDDLQKTVVTGALSNITGAISVAYPSGFTRDNCYALSFEVYAGDAWRAGEGFYASSFSRTYYVLGSTAIQIYNDNSLVYNSQFRLVLAKL